MQKQIHKRHVFWSISSILFIAISYLIFDAIRPFLISFILAYLFLPFIDKIEKKFKINRGITSAAIVIILFCVFSIIVSFVLPFVYTKVASFFNEFLINRNGVLSNKEVIKLSSLLNIEKDVAQQIIFKIKSWFSSIDFDLSSIIKPTNAVSSVITCIATIFIMPIVTFYMLKDWKKNDKSIFLHPS